MPSNNHPNVLLLGNRSDLLHTMEEALKQEGYRVITADDDRSGLEAVRRKSPQVVVLDLPDDESIQLLENLKSTSSDMDVILLSSAQDTRYLVKAIRLGAADIVHRPAELQDVLLSIEKSVERKRFETEASQFHLAHITRELEDQLIGASDQMEEVRRMIRQVADTDLTVIIRGESGTGKELVARALHNLSKRHRSPFIKVNCAALPQELLEAELFGYEKGAFTSAYASKPGRFEFAQNGTIFLDEIGEVHPGLQSKLLQVLEQKEFIRLGGRKNVRVDVRIITATNADLREALTEGSFRSDLFFRINEVSIDLPPLRERMEDIPILTDHFLRIYNHKYGHNSGALRPGTVELLISYDWPGNVRELENLIKKIVVFEDESVVAATLNVKALPSAELDESCEIEGFSLKDASKKVVEQTERALIRDALNKTNWNRTKAAKLLGISYRSLLYKIKAFGIEGG